MGMEHAEEPPVSVSRSQPYWAGSFAVAALAASTSSAVVATQPVERAWSPEIAQDSSPPPLQSLLCTFLI